uniref:Uncharacterized protein n=1 Tax=Solanum tuberosum TaxID=4113 RepID=M1AVY7_SOLTU
MNMRKILEVDVMVDYNGGGGANTAHTPGKGSHQWYTRCGKARRPTERGRTNGIQDVALPQGLQREVIGQMNVRKLLAVDATVDYDEGGPNFSHTPGKGNPPIGAKVAN